MVTTLSNSSSTVVIDGSSTSFRSKSKNNVGTYGSAALAVLVMISQGLLTFPKLPEGVKYNQYGTSWFVSMEKSCVCILLQSGPLAQRMSTLSMNKSLSQKSVTHFFINFFLTDSSIMEKLIWISLICFQKSRLRKLRTATSDYRT